MTDKTLNWYNAISLTMTLGEHAKTFREVFNQECLDNISRYGFIKKQLWDMQVGLINEESCEFLDAAEELYAEPAEKGGGKGSKKAKSAPKKASSKKSKTKKATTKEVAPKKAAAKKKG